MSVKTGQEAYLSLFHNKDQLRQLFQSQGWKLIINYLSEQKENEAEALAYMTNIDLVAIGKRQGKIQTIDAVLGLPEHIDQYKSVEDSNKLKPISNR